MPKRDDDDDVNPFAAPVANEYADDDNEADGQFEYGTFLIRFLAVFIDGVIQNVLGLVLNVIGGIAILASGIDEKNPLPIIILSLLGIVVGWLYVAGFNSSSSQGTPGKMLLGLKVVDLQGKRIGFTRATGRHFATILSAFTLLIGFLMQPFTEKKQALHDILAGTLVVKRRK